MVSLSIMNLCFRNSFVIVEIFVGNVILVEVALQQTVIYNRTIVCKLGLCCYVLIHMPSLC